jgi:hypothetical protein
LKTGFGGAFVFFKNFSQKLLFLRLLFLFYSGGRGLDFLRFGVIPEAESAARFEPANEV